jgi:hypothetical protein
MNEELVAALADALGAPIAAGRLAAIATQLGGQLASQGGSSAEELEGVEPAITFEPAIVFEQGRDQ